MGSSQSRPTWLARRRSSDSEKGRRRRHQASSVFFPIQSLSIPGGVGLPGRLIDGMALGQRLGIRSSVALCRCHQADPAVAMLVVVPLHEVGHPLAGVVKRGESVDGVAGSVLAVRNSASE